jgi:ribosome biogenesis SPOUT family RNA methylase Rps3
MLVLAGQDATVHFTNLSTSTANSLLSTLASKKDSIAPTAKINATTISVLELMKQNHVPIDRVCLLDPKARLELSPQDGEGGFDWFLFGVRDAPNPSLKDP